MILVRRILSVAASFVILLALTIYGAVEPATYLSLTLVMGGILLAGVSLFGLPAKPKSAILVTVGIAAAVTVWVVAQTTPLPAKFMSDDAWRELAEPAAGVISLSPGDDLAALLKVLLPFAGFLVTLILFDTDERALGFLRLLVLGAAILAAVALAQFFEDPGSLLFVEKRFYRDSFTGFFVNRNTAATFFATALLASIALTLRTLKRIPVAALTVAWNTVGPLSPVARSALLRAGFSLFLTLVLLVALVLTKSRAGIGCFVVALGVLMLIRTFGSRKHGAASGTTPVQIWRRRAGVGLALIAVLFSINLVFGQVLLRAQTASTTDPRFCVIPAIARAVLDHLPAGSGLASFRTVFPAYRDASCGIAFVWDMAHNVYLEGLLSLGLLFPVVLLCALYTLSRIFVLGMKTRRRYRFAPQLGLAVLLLVVLHSALDFSIQIPGYALYFATILGCLVTISTGGGAAKREDMDGSAST
ncbi:O-antigen ligase family protein [Rhizobium sp. CC-YZS058]|uniref:O-antigen ligase family protein n=1 Tax=Rhizobium sp. CC-YZS058 TaxID=3042153 RepID=UPI002B05A2A3|nr:O-antigen ligase family protein [Rhizobium sp. CC-YZS058]MEA3535438.1 O-antigen ligase family protein [Rhizobium sp. CC-YZS058]